MDEKDLGEPSWALALGSLAAALLALAADGWAVASVWGWYAVPHGAGPITWLEGLGWLMAVRVWVTVSGRRKSVKAKESGMDELRRDNRLLLVWTSFKAAALLALWGYAGWP